MVLAAAALIPGAAVFAQQAPQIASNCLVIIPDSLHQAVEASSVITVARVQSVEPESHAVLVPEALLKGSTSQKALVLRYPESDAERCSPPAVFTPGMRVLAFLTGKDGGLYWPAPDQVFVLDSGKVVQQGDGGGGWPVRTEQQFTSEVRGITGQYVVPAANPSEGASIDWVKTVIPVTVALLIVLGIGLYLMRIWHRIDPT